MDKTKFRPIGVENDKADNSVIAPVESGTTASRAYAKGAHFIRDSAFCTAKTAIAQGEAFGLNTNYTAGTIGDRVAALETVSLVRLTTSHTVRWNVNSIRKCGRLVTLNFNIQLSSNVTAYNSIMGTIPNSAYYPIESLWFAAVDGSTGGRDAIMLTLTSEGKLQSTINLSSGLVIAGSCAYMSAT